MLPFGCRGYVLGLLTAAYYYGVFAMSWDLLFGFAGEVNFGPTFLIGIGAYTAAHAQHTPGCADPACLAAGAVAAVVGGAAAGGAGAAAARALFRPGDAGRGAAAAERHRAVRRHHRRRDRHDLPDVLSIDATANYWYALGFMVVSGAILFGLSRSTVGLILQASGQDAIEAAALGFNVTKHKLAAFCVSALFSGLAGAMLIFYMGTASVDTVVDIAHRRADHHRRRAGRAAHHPGRGARLDLPDRRRRGAAPARPAQHLRRLGGRAGGDPVLPRRLAGPRCCAAREARMTQRRPCWRSSGLTKRFGGLVAVKDIGFDIRGGEILGLIGPNGSGKSTVMKLIMGIERAERRQREAGGHRDRRLADAPHRPRRHRHRVPALAPAASADRAGKHQARAAAGPPAAARRRPQVGTRAREIAERVGLGAVMHRLPRDPAVRRSAPAGDWPRRWRAIPRWCWWTSRSPA